MKELPPLPLDFYDCNSWHDTILNFYGVNPKFPPKNILDKPILLLTKSVGNIIDIYGNFPHTHLNLFKQTINPLYEHNEYEQMVYNSIKSAAIEESQPKFNRLADSLLVIRWLFSKNRGFLLKKFSEEVRMINKPTDEDKILFFLDSMRIITRTHINQIINIILEETKI